MYAHNSKGFEKLGVRYKVAELYAVKAARVPCKVPIITDAKCLGQEISVTPSGVCRYAT